MVCVCVCVQGVKGDELFGLSIEKVKGLIVTLPEAEDIVKAWERNSRRLLRQGASVEERIKDMPRLVRRGGGEEGRRGGEVTSSSGSRVETCICAWK